MWKINKKFLDSQVEQGKSFRVTHDPTTGSSTYSGYYKHEIDYLIKKGYKIKKTGRHWYAAKK